MILKFGFVLTALLWFKDNDEHCDSDFRKNNPGVEPSKSAYRQWFKTLHPDKGGDAATYKKAFACFEKL